MQTYAHMLGASENVELLKYYPKAQRVIRRPTLAAGKQLPLNISANPAEAQAAAQLGAAQALLERCRPHCQLRRSTGMHSAPIATIAHALGMTAPELEAALAPLQLARLHQIQITPHVPRPFIGIAATGACWINL